ncbi:hypothetical protein [Actinoplanes sp. NPDC049118]|uniref:hypothetical protein n=1 Tax=Actinoplanes sp. NPDC049118 TaxID=3155769 RepID=UPI0033D34051
MSEPGPPLFLAGNPRDNQTGGIGVGAVIAVVLLMLGSGAAGLFGLLIFPYASDACGNPDLLICTGNGQLAVGLGPMSAAIAGSAIAGCSLALRPPYRAAGIMLGYVVGFSGFVAAAIIVSQV